jgi:hypothetical protein
VRIFRGFGVSNRTGGSDGGEVGIGGVGSVLGTAWQWRGQGEGEGRAKRTAKAKGARIGVRRGAWVKEVAAAMVVSKGRGSVLARSSSKGGGGVAWVAKGKSNVLI